MIPQILIVDDEPNVRFILERCLSHDQYTIDIAAEGTTAIKMLAQKPYDLVLLDLHMEPVDGLEVLNFAREQDPDLVAIILTAYSSIESAVEALRLGAFDYLFKPAKPDTIRQRVKEGVQHRRQALQFRQVMSQIENLRHTLDELAPRIEANIPHGDSQRFVQSGKLVIDRQHRLAALDGQLLDLTTTEFDLLLCIVEATPEPLSPRQLVNCALGYDCDELEARDIAKWHIHHLRRKIEPDPNHLRYIKTIRHKGYMWSGEQDKLISAGL